MTSKADEWGKKISLTTMKVVGHVDEKYKVKDSFLSGAVKSYKYAKSIDDIYQISSMTTKMAVRGQQVFADVRERDPTGVLSFLERYTVDAWGYILEYTAPVLEHAAALVKEEKVIGDNPIDDSETEMKTGHCSKEAKDSESQDAHLDDDIYSV